MASESSASPPGPFSLSFGGNFIEFTALTTLIGSTAAESLVLGNHGAAGVAWATMSAFGLVWVIRACTSAASPGWLRETMGIRTPVSDMAVGMELSSNSSSRAAAKIRNHNNVSGPLGLVVESNKTSHTFIPEKEQAKRWSDGIKSWTDVYAFNLQTSLLLSMVPDAGHGVVTHTRGSSDHRDQGFHHIPVPPESGWRSISVYTYAPYTFYRQHNQRVQVSALVLSLIKLGESVTLWAYDSGWLLVVIAALPWVYFFAVASFLEVRELFLARRPEEVDGHLDILAGQFPSMARTGGPRKIIIGAPRNPRTSTWWRIIWGVGAVVCTSSLILTYMLLGQQTNDVVLLWALFQGSWMLARMFVYHFAEPTDVVARRMLVERPWDTLSTSMKARVLELMIACARYHTLVHPRGMSMYNADSFTSSELASILIDTPSMKKYPLPLKVGYGDHIAVNVQAVIGDTILASAAWVSGLEGLAPRDLYDCCVMSLSLGSPSISPAAAIPAVRFFSGAQSPEVESDIENHIPQIVPKGAPNIGGGTWWYYVPLENELWLLIKKESPNTIIGKQSAEIVNDAHITSQLARGNLAIGLTHVDEIKHTARLSEKAIQAVLKLLVG